ncbi:hypothetical protein SSX86_002010 [Deinandra increscens subsp. villosa]|uniref:Reverse transcriptase n=1 Tax=Deinandra increscens subsp. villosa TaxID=3103831 RepID=A0AAP0H7M2_9ASTR
MLEPATSQIFKSAGAESLSATTQISTSAVYEEPRSQQSGAPTAQVLQGSSTRPFPEFPSRFRAAQDPQGSLFSNPSVSAGMFPNSSQEMHEGYFIPMQVEKTTKPTILRDAGYGPQTRSQNPRINPTIARELQRLKDMISSVPGVIRPIPEMHVGSHRVSRSFEKLTGDLYRIVQKSDESLWDYVARFGREALDIPNLDMAADVEAFKMVLGGDSHFYDDLVMTPCRNLNEVRTRALRFIRLGDDKKIQKRSDVSKPESSSRITDSPGKQQRSKPYYRNDNHRVNAVEDEEDEEDFPKVSDYCFSVDVSGLLCALQDLDDCIALRKEISYLLSKGHLKELFGRKKSKTQDAAELPKRAQSPPANAKVINFISGGSDICGSSFSSAKRHAREAKMDQGSRPKKNAMLTEDKIIFFDETDNLDIQDPHHDSLLDVLKKMSIPEEEIILRSSVLVGFSGETKHTIRDIRLPVVLVGTNIPEDTQEQLVNLLKSRTTTFAWKHEDMTGISKDIITHKLGIDESFRPIHQKRRKFAPEINIIIQEEVNRLLKSKMIREVNYPRWLANVVVVQKKYSKWRVCVDYTDLNKACPKDPFPLPHIDSMVDATTGHEMLTFIDASSGFQQIHMEPSDQEDTAFMTPTGICCYIAMPFGLRNAGATYQRLVNMIFKDQLGDTMEVYIDDMVVKSKKAKDHPRDLEAAFYMVTERGIEASPEQIQEIINLKSPTNVKEVQRLTGRVAALNRFISRSSEKSNILKKNKKFEWAIKSQALADFVADFSSDILPEVELEVKQLQEASGSWILYTDGASNFRGTGLGALLKLPQGDIIPLSIYCEFNVTNNEAEYEALIAGLQLAKDMVKGERLTKYLDLVKNLALSFENCSISHVPREENAEADALANLASSLRIP